MISHTNSYLVAMTRKSAGLYLASLDSMSML